MMLARTTIRIKASLKRDAEIKAARDNLTLQEVFNRALEYYLRNESKLEAKRIIFKTHNLGKPLDNLRRKDYYPDPQV